MSPHQCLYDADITVPPQNVQVTDVTTTSITVTFDPIPCLDQTANITGYAVDFGRSGNLPFAVGTIIENFTYTQTRLSKNTSYFFEIYPVVEPALGLTVQKTAPINLQTLSGECTSIGL